VIKLWRILLLYILAMVSVQSTLLSLPTVYVSAIPTSAAAAKNNNKNKTKKPKRQKILKGRHGKHKPKPAKALISN